MSTDQRPGDDPIEALLAHARAGGPNAILAARRAAVLAQKTDARRAIEALAIAARLDPLAHAPRLALARLHAEQGDLPAARAEAAGVLAEGVDQTARARAAFMLGELARAGGEPAQARGFFETALKIEEELLALDRSDPSAARWYARARGRLAELDSAERKVMRARSGAEGALAMLRASAAQIGEPPMLAADIADAEMRLAALELDSDEAESARRRLGQAITRYEALAVTEPDEAHWRAVLSDAWALAAEAEFARGAAQLAREAMDKALQARLVLAARDPGEAWGLAGAWRLQAALMAALEDAPAATQALAQARTLAAQLAKDGGDAPARFLSHTLLDQADHALRTGDLALARDSADEARMRAEAHARQTGADPVWLSDVGACWDRLGEVARLAKAPEKALDAFTRASEFRRMACERAPENQSFIRGLAAALVKLGDAALEAGAAETARAALADSTNLRIALLEAAPNDLAAAQALAVALERLGLAARACGDVHAARGAWADELALAERIFDDADIEGIRFRAIVHSHLASLSDADKEAHRQEALAGFDELAKAGVLTSGEAALRKKLWGG